MSELVILRVAGITDHESFETSHFQTWRVLSRDVLGIPSIDQIEEESESFFSRFQVVVLHTGQLNYGKGNTLIHPEPVQIFSTFPIQLKGLVVKNLDIHVCLFVGFFVTDKCFLWRLNTIWKINKSLEQT